MNLRLKPIFTGIICSAVLLASCGGGRDSMGAGFGASLGGADASDGSEGLEDGGDSGPFLDAGAPEGPPGVGCDPDSTAMGSGARYIWIAK